jgi:peptide/nickel transport system ATP-binding protein
MSTLVPPDGILAVEELKKHFIVGYEGLVRRKPIMVRAVDNVSFSIGKGETLGLVGESGSGKSTVAFTVLGRYSPTSGRILFRGQELPASIEKRPIWMKRAIQMVFQDPGTSLNPRRSVGQTLSLALRFDSGSGNTRKEVSRLLDVVELPTEYAEKYPRSLGGGEKQLVALARALATNPSFVILDEPTSSLDVSMQAKIIDLLLRLRKELDLTCLFITHDLSLMRNVASRVAIMYLGKVAEIAPTEEFFRSPQHPYTRMLLSAIPVTSEEEERLKPEKVTPEGEIPSPVDVPSGCSFRTRCPVVMDVCSSVDPLFTPLGAGRSVRCHLYADHGPTDNPGC